MTVAVSSLIGRTVTVKVPATTANLGPGFDTLGLALSLYDELTVTVREQPGVLVRVSGVGEGEVATDETNLVVQSIAATLAKFDQQLPGLDVPELHCSVLVSRRQSLVIGTERDALDHVYVSAQREMQLPSANIPQHKMSKLQ